MSSSPFAVPGAKLTLALSLAMTLIGFVGLIQSLALLSISAETPVRPIVSSTPEVEEAVGAYQRAMIEAPAMRADAVANLLASALLLIASTLMTARARSALWWTTQAMYANVAYSTASAAISVYLKHVFRSRIDAISLASMNGSEIPPDGVGSAQTIFFFVSIVGSIVFAILMGGLYLALLRLSRREDVQRFVRRET